MGPFLQHENIPFVPSSQKIWLNDIGFLLEVKETLIFKIQISEINNEIEKLEARGLIYLF